jgi:hypothetical protein
MLPTKAPRPTTFHHPDAQQSGLLSAENGENDRKVKSWHTIYQAFLYELFRKTPKIKGLNINFFQPQALLSSYQNKSDPVRAGEMASQIHPAN